MTSNIPALKSRKPTGAVPWPLILLEGPEKSGKSWSLAEFTRDERLGQAYWMDLGEGSADEYAAIEGANYEVVEHDGTYLDILGQVRAVHAEAKRANAAGEKPVVFFIDSMYHEWELLKDWTYERARRSNAGKRALQKDPDAEVKPANGLWNDANTRHYRIMYLLMTFPGIVVMTARGKETSVIGPDGKPVLGEKDYRVESQKNLGYDSSAWVRLSRDSAPIVVGLRSVHAGIRPGIDKAKPAPSFTLSWLVFDALKCDPKTAHVRNIQELNAHADLADIVAEEQGHDRRAPEPQRQGGIAGLNQRNNAQAPDPEAEQKAAEDFIEKVSQETDKATLLQMHAWAATGLAPDFVDIARQKVMERATELGFVEKKAAPAAEPTPDEAAANVQESLGAEPVPTS